ncbi:acyl-CoA synthetase, putative [Hepatocystis sp. ex Piliocolobus tephrosceles]|nr:acyl-CoA synthetase, putative [Hepatocystis sp. ex Piliocolobus tephrosceles]
MIIFYVLAFFLIFFKLSLYYCQHLKGMSHVDVVDNSMKSNESGIYRLRTHDKLLEDEEYTHVLNFFAKRNIPKEKQALVTEFDFGKVTISYNFENLLERAYSFAYSLETFNGGIPTKTYDEDKNKGKFKMLGIYGNNSINWFIADLACMISGTTALVMHSKFSIDEVIDILNESKVEWLSIDINLISEILKKKNKLPYLNTLIVLDNFNYNSNNISISGENVKKHIRTATNKNDENSNGHDEDISTNSSENGDKEELSIKNIDETIKSIEKKKEMLIKVKEEALKVKVKIYHFDELIINDIKERKIKNEDPDFISTIVYTSGTSGKPKGVMISNKNIFYVIKAVISLKLFNIYKPKKYFSYLPLSHIYERIVFYTLLYNNVNINIWSKDLSYFSKDLYNSRTNVLVGVPKIFNRLYSSIMTEISKLSTFKRFMVKTILALRRMNNNGLISQFLESITNISKQIRNKIDPDLLLIVNGGGKISKKVQSELNLLLNIDFYQGYGLTETTGPIFVQTELCNDNNNVGSLISPYTQFKVVSWEVFDAKANPPQGELLVKGDQLFNGYFLKKQETKNAFDEDLFFKTGDIVQINNNGTIKFLDRCKGLVKLSQGEYIETDMLNNLYSDIPFINFCVVYGNESMDGPLAIISIDKQIFLQTLREDACDLLDSLGMTEEQFEANTNDEDFNHKILVDYVKEKMYDKYKQTNLNRYNVINDIYLTVKPWDMTNYLTPTYKVRRLFVFKDYNFFIEKVKKYYKMKLEV